METILVVDDLATNRKMLCQILTSLREYRVIEASSGGEALELFERERPDLVLMDIDMPGMNGCESAGRIKQLSGTLYTPVIFVTALSAETNLASSLAAGGDDFIGKPFEVGVLDARVRAHLRIRELSRSLAEQNQELQMHNQRLLQEQELVEHFFSSSLLQSDLDSELIRLHMSPMSVFNGDLFLVERGPRGGLYLVTGDFTGHGLSAAMGTLPVALIFFRLARQGGDLGEMARELNVQLHRLLPPGMFFAATLLELSPRADRLSVWQGGMPETLWLDAGGKLKGAVASRHMPLGILEDDEFDDSVEVLPVRDGDRLYLYSDGLTEATDATGRMFGHARAREVLLGAGEDRFYALLEEVERFTSRQKDDLTLVELTCRPLPPGGEPVAGEAMPRRWEFGVTLGIHEIRADDALPAISRAIAGIPGLGRHRGLIAMIMSEMYANALDHSILGLDSRMKSSEAGFADYYEERRHRLQELETGSVRFQFRCHDDGEGPLLTIRVSDSGQGFRDGLAPAGAEALHGRGLQILSELCEELVFSDNGCILEVRLRL